MSLPLWKVLSAIYQNLGELNSSKATGGSTTTIVDSILANTSKDNVWKEGAAFILRDAGGANALPEGQFQRISAYTNSSGTFTVDTAFTTAVASGDLYGIVSSYYPLQQVMIGVNEALGELGDVDLVDTTTLDTIAETTEYAAAVAWKRKRPYRIDIQTLTGVTGDNAWREVNDWDWVPATAGSTGKIIFPKYQYASRDIRVWYRDAHPLVNAYSDVISETIDPELFKKAALVKALEWQNSRTQGADQFLMQKLNASKQELENRRITNPTERVKRRPRYLIVGGNDVTYDDFTWPAPA